MRTNNIMYQAAIAHQIDLRRTASQRNQSVDRDSGRSEWVRRFSGLAAKRTSAKTTAAPSSNGIAISV